MGWPSRAHWNDGEVPVACTVNVVKTPSQTVRDPGLEVMAGAVLIASSQALLVSEVGVHVPVTRHV